MGMGLQARLPAMDLPLLMCGWAMASTFCTAAEGMLRLLGWGWVGVYNRDMVCISWVTLSSGSLEGHSPDFMEKNATID